MYHDKLVVFDRFYNEQLNLINFPIGTDFFKRLYKSAISAHNIETNNLIHSQSPRAICIYCGYKLLKTALTKH